MFRSLLWFEIKNRLVRLSSMIYFVAFFAGSFLLAITFGGAFGISFSPGGLSEKLALNSPQSIHSILCGMGCYGLLIVAPIFGQSVNQDFEGGFYQILFTTPIRKSTYFFTRFLGSFLSSIVIFLSIGLGMWIATLMPFIDQTTVTKNVLWFYVAPYLSTIIPNIVIFGAIFMAVVSLFKKMAPVYIASIATFVVLTISQVLVQDLDNKIIASLIDPFGLESAHQLTKYWSVAEKSTFVTPMTGLLLFNRLLWMAIGMIVLGLSYLFFNPFTLPQDNKKMSKETKALNASNFSGIKDFKTKLMPHSWKVFFQLAISEFKQAFSNIFFLIIVFLGILNVFVINGYLGLIFGTETLPVTYKVLEVVTNSFSLFVIFITTYYAGELIWKDKEQHVEELIDSKPVSNLFLYLSKVFSLFFIQVFLALIVLICSVLMQAFQGYYHFEWNVYMQYLFVYTMPSWLLFCIVALFIHTMSFNKPVGHMINVLYIAFRSFLPSLGLDHHLYYIGYPPTVPYSDMNGFGTALYPFTIFLLYWGFFHGCLAILTVLFWQRGMMLTWKDRLTEFKFRLKPIHKSFFATSLFLWLILGGFIYYNTNILNIYRTKVEKEHAAVDYEVKYSHFEKMPHPVSISANVEVDIFPESQSMHGKGIFKYRNQSDQPIKTMMVFVPQASKVSQLDWSQPVDLIQYDERFGIRIYDFLEPLQPNEEIQLQIVLKVIPKGFQHVGFSSKIVENGTFFRGNDFFPTLGYISYGELKDEKKRKKYGLPEKSRIPSIDDLEAQKRPYITDNWIDFEATISTSADQIGIAPGYLEKEWEENGRRYFHYKMDRPILNYYAFLSARYEVVRDRWNDVNIEVYHHPGHTYNIPRMINSVKKSLDYYTTHFSPYQFQQVRIVEFPRYSSHAEALPNTIPYSESIGFIAKVKPNDPESIDYPFYITAHEVAHQWWAHQVIGGLMQGCMMLTESLAQYSAMMVMEKEYGPLQMKKFLKYELDRYLVGRSLEQEKELPLMLNENQQYICYQKGSLVFYALKDCLGEETVNKVLRDFISDFAFQKPLFTARSIDLVQRFKEVAPEDKKYLIEDMFETITFYDNRITNASFQKIADDKYEVKIQSMNKKLRADDLGHEHEIPMNDYVDIGIYDKERNFIYLEKHKIKEGLNTFSIIVDQKPSKVKIDPLNKMIDKTLERNAVALNEVEG